MPHGLVSTGKCKLSEDHAALLFMSLNPVTWKAISITTEYSLIEVVFNVVVFKWRREQTDLIPTDLI
jgi:hypothetical protein